MLPAGNANSILASHGAGVAPSWIDPSAINLINYWQLNGEVLAPGNLSYDLALGGSSTSTAKFQIFANSGNASSSGTLTFTGNTSTNRIAAMNQSGLFLAITQLGTSFLLRTEILGLIWQITFNQEKNWILSGERHCIRKPYAVRRISNSCCS